MRTIEKQNSFLKNEIWSQIFSAAFQRANVYAAHISDQQKVKFKTDLRRMISEDIIVQYLNGLNEDSHIENIKRVSEYTSTGAINQILQNGLLNIGVSQKLLNLALKYYWCLGYIKKAPPHCPVDRLVQERGLKLKQYEIVSWTQITSIEAYIEIMEKIRLEAKSEGLSIAEWELEIFERRQEINNKTKNN